eukprot:TRINITY_DN5286_c0_g1_i2.p1 TRINITY_DN5286_c0_g1~~TRINITY_DN5286_c0_g1_i2.p1  ORF type:complete len:335 (-),score=75.28 TRINITY_DN5286_c0_g1_i2:322-1326(-)
MRSCLRCLQSPSSPGLRPTTISQCFKFVGSSTVRRADPRLSFSSAVSSPPPTPQRPAAPTSVKKVDTVKETFYMRPLPSHLVPFSSQDGRALFMEAMALGGMESYWKLAEQFHTQTEPAYCGLATLSMALNALQVDPRRQWKGVWRWFSEDMLDCCTPLEVVKEKGITLKDFACLVKCNGAEATMYAAEESTEEDFRRMVVEMCCTPVTPSRRGTSGSEGPSRVLVSSFSRKILGQTGDGHFACLAGYHPEKDMVLVMDTAKFKYPAFWCKLSELYAAMQPVDPVAGRPRGYVVVSRRDHADCGPRCQFTVDNTSWPGVSDHLSNRLPQVPNLL